ncbi:multicopper oxidase family protein [Actinophytocola sp.]|uniref:multicopper oxidase family protein n=1 Tax=Actinophytocola sp. TaxID=1872138 RepID=UPI002ED22954
MPDRRLLNRRRLLTLGGITAGGILGGAVLLPKGQTPAPGGTGHNGHGVEPVAGTRSIRPETQFSQRMPVPRQLTPTRATGVDLYRIPIQPGQAEFRTGHPTAVRTYAGQFVGPTIRAKTGRPVRVTFTNELDVASNVHLHGGHVPQSSDGHPMDMIAPGQSRTYDYPNTQQGATLWYHDHAHHLEAENVYFGLHGFYIIEDDAEKNLGLPGGPYDVPIMLRDAELDANGALVYPSHPPNRTTILANGVVTPNFPVAARKYRFRLLNAANERTFSLSLGGAALVQIGSDGGLLPAPVVRSEIVLGSAERADVVIDFSGHPIGSHLVLYDVSGPVLRFDVTRAAPDPSVVPAVLRPLPALPPATVERDIAMKFDLSGAEPVALVNGRPYDPNRVDFRVKRGTTEIWHVRNDDVEFGIPHTFHLHLEQFRVLDRNGAPPSLDDAGRKDTIFIAPGETVRVQVTFTDHLGKYVYHCHYLEHSALGMMAQMEVVA